VPASKLRRVTVPARALKLRKVLIEAVLARDEAEAKEEVLDLLVRPYEELAELFVKAFENYRPKVTINNWADPIELGFYTQIPSSDTIRNVIFSLYDIVWGGKPEGLECIYRGLVGTNQYNNQPVVLYIATKPDSIAKIISASRQCTVLDDKEYKVWKDITNRHREANRIARMEQLKKSGHVFDPGQPVPVLRSGLFKI
jgi:hypothetical protein